MPKAIAGIATEVMPQVASKGKRVVRPVQKIETGDGHVRYSAVSQSQKLFRDYYFLQYLFGAPQAMVFLTVEGYGNAGDAAKRYDAVPSTDAVLYISENSPQAIDALRTLARTMSDSAGKPLSDVVLAWSPTGWLVAGGPAE